jgi:hypothetical protein
VICTLFLAFVNSGGMVGHFSKLGRLVIWMIVLVGQWRVANGVETRVVYCSSDMDDKD